MTQLFALLGMALGLIKDIARAQDSDSDFDWMGWLGERPFQVVGRLLVTVGILAPEGAELAQDVLSSVNLAAAPAVQVVVPVLIGLYGDKVQKKALERVEDVSAVVPVVRKLFAWGKKLT